MTQIFSKKAKMLEVFLYLHSSQVYFHLPIDSVIHFSCFMFHANFFNVFVNLTSASIFYQKLSTAFFSERRFLCILIFELCKTFIRMLISFLNYEKFH